jgi:hypothetical protein
MSTQINQFGNGLQVLILCEATGADNFLAFASVYSLQKHLPDAQLAIACKRPEQMMFDVFPWAYKLGIPFFYYQKNEPTAVAIKRNYLKLPILTLSCDIMCLSPFDQEILDRIDPNGITDGCSLANSVKSQDLSSLCSIQEGCGSFVPASWIHKGGHPFGQTNLYGRGNLTRNEKRVFDLWKKLCPVYDGIL